MTAEVLEKLKQEYEGQIESLNLRLNKLLECLDQHIPGTLKAWDFLT